MIAQSDLQIVVAHYDEDLSWLDPFAETAVIYSKGGQKNTPSYPHTALPNIGREGHTYLYHIAHHYHDLPEVTLFLQGRIDDHISITSQEMIDRSLKTKPGEVTTFPFRELEVFDNWDGIPWEKYPCWAKWSSMASKKAPKTPAQYWKTFFGDRKVPTACAFQPGALFAVHRKTIQKYPQSFYQNLLQELFCGEMAHVNPETGHYMERFWLPMWQPSEYIIWDNEHQRTEQHNRKMRNAQGQLAKGYWHRVPMGQAIDVAAMNIM